MITATALAWALVYIQSPTGLHIGGDRQYIISTHEQLAECGKAARAARANPTRGRFQCVPHDKHLDEVIRHQR